MTGMDDQPSGTAFDVVVVGGGVTGTFTALELARRGRRVAIVERKVPGVEASGLNAGTLSVQNKPLGLLALAREGVDGWERFETDTGLQTEFERTGGLRVAEDADDVARLEAALVGQRHAGLDVEIIDGEAARARCRALGPAVVAAAYSPYEAHNDALQAGRLVGIAAERAGVVVLTGREVEDIQHRQGAWDTMTSAGTLRSEEVVLCAGLWLQPWFDRFAPDLQLQLRSNQVMVTEPTAPLLDSIVTHVRGRFLTLKQVPAGSILIGGGWPGRALGDVRQKWPSKDSMIGNARFALRAVPRIGNLRVIRSWEGYDGLLPDGLPIIGPMGPDGLWIASSSQGQYTLSPAVGNALATWITTGSQPESLKGFGVGQREIAGNPRMVAS